MNAVSLVIADDHPLLLEGLKAHLERLQYNIVGSARDGAAALKEILDKQPQVAIVDIEMPYMSGIEVVQACANKTPNTKFILLTLHKELSYIARAKKLEISGYILKDDALTEIDTCIKTVLKGEQYFSSAISIIDNNEIENKLGSLEKLTPSQLKILNLVASGLSTKDIASRLYISERTVEKHRSNIIMALGIDTNKDNLFQWIHKNKHLFNLS